MKANELRVTNFVLNDGVVNSVIFIGYDSVQLVTKQGNTITAHLDLIKPIPLTEEWLLKFGFVIHSDYTYRNYVNPKTKFTISIWMGAAPVAGFEITGAFYWGESFKEIQHVHQLQNLYFALTGTELELVNLVV